MNNRLTWADNAKALGMILVFWGHLIERGAFTGQSMLVHDLYKAIYSFHMPFFFLLAGYFFRSREIRFGSLMVQKFKSRLVPVIFFVGISTLMWQVPAWWGLPDSPEDALSAQQKFWLLLQGVPAVNWPCWFLVCLFVVEMVASELVPFIKNRMVHVVTMLIVAWLAFVVASDAPLTALRMGFQEKNWWFWQESTVALGFYLMGVFLYRYTPWLMPAGNRLSHAVFVGSVVAFLLLFNRNFADGLGVVNMSGSAHGTWPIFWSAAVMGGLALIHIAAYVPAVSLLKYIGNNTIPLLGINGLMLEFFYGDLWRMCESFIADPVIVPLTLLVAFASLLLCLPIVFLLNKLVPFLVGQWK